MIDVKEKELIQKAKNGDHLAQSKIIKSYEKMVYNLGLKLLGNEEGAECILQETFLKVLQALPKFREESQLSTWIYRIATNQALMQLRGQKKKQLILDDNLDDIHKDYSAFNRSLEADPLGLLINKELRQKMDEAISELPDNYKAVFVLKDVKGFALKEIAEMLDISLPAVKSNLHRARIFLRNKLSEIYN